MLSSGLNNTFAPVKKIFTGAFFFFITNLGIAHPLHLSTTSIECDEHNNYSVIVKVFISDIQCSVSNVKDEKLVLEYISNHLKLKRGDVVFPLKFVSYRLESDAIWYKFLIQTSVQNIETIENKILFDRYDDQINLILFTCQTESEGYKCTISNAIIKL